MGAVQRHNFEIVKKGYDPEAVDGVILELTIAKNDAEALATKLRKQLEQGPSAGATSTEAAKIIADAKQQARQIIDEAHRQAESTLGGARAEAHRVMTGARSAVIDGDGPTPAPATLRKLLAIAERFETQVTALARGALADTSSLTKELEATLAAEVTNPAPPAPAPQRPVRERQPSRPTIPDDDDEGGSTLDMLRKRAAEKPTEEPAAAEVRKPAPAAPPAEDTGLAARIARQAKADAAAAAGHEINQEPDTSLASRVAREKGLATSEEKQDSDDRGSYYSRRSARLPRIGEEATAGAMAAVRSVRKGGEGAATDDDERAAQTA